jgi:hypothetical protein
MNGKVLLFSELFPFVPSMSSGRALSRVERRTEFVVRTKLGG